MDEPYVYERSARDPRALALIGASLAVVLALILVVEAAWWITLLVGVATVPAVVEAFRDARSRLMLDATAISWESGHHRRSVPLSRVAEVTLATRLDFSQRASVHLTTGDRLRIPPQCLPGGRRLDAELAARGVPHRRALFSS
jgi:hypothetical protein